MGKEILRGSVNAIMTFCFLVVATFLFVYFRILEFLKWALDKKGEGEML